MKNIWEKYYYPFYSGENLFYLFNHPNPAIAGFPLLTKGGE
jgi:hypothetical protein